MQHLFMKQVLLTTILFMGIFMTSCAPKVGRIITKSYQPTQENVEVNVYFNKDDIKTNVEALGIISAGDGGLTTKCDSLTIINLLKTETRKIGGDALYITEHIRPNFWGSSCHQMTATVLKTGGELTNDTVAAKLRPEIVETKVFKPQRVLSKFRLSADFGYGWRTAKMISGLDQASSSLLQQTKGGITPSVDFTYFINDNNGFGLLYNSHRANGSIFGAFEGGQIASIRLNTVINMYGSQYVVRAPIAEQWEFFCDLGAGYTTYDTEISIQNNKAFTSSASTLGSILGVGIDYKLSKKWAVGIQAKYFSGIVTSFQTTENGVTKTVELSKDEYEGLNNIQLAGGIRFNF